MEIRHYRLPDFPDIRDTLVDVYREVYAEDIATDPFAGVDRFVERLNNQASLDDWEAAVGWEAGEAVGYAYGGPLPVGSRWWRTMRDPLPSTFTAETGRRTFAVFEVMVRDPWRGTGVAYRLHESLLSARPEERATLLVDADHLKVRARYEDWGYEFVGDQQPFPDSPIFNTMLRPLR